MTLTLDEAIAEVRAFTPWDQSEFELDTIGFKPSIRKAIAYILQAAASGDLTPSAGLFSSVKTYTEAEVKLAVALAYQRAAGVVDARRSILEVGTELSSRILALADTDALEEVRALKTAHEDTCAKLNGYITYAAEQHDRAEAAEAEVARLREALENIASGPDPEGIPSYWISRVIQKARAALQPKVKP